MFPTRLEGIETRHRGKVTHAEVRFPTRLEGIETCR